MEALRYRAEDIARSLTRSAIKEVLLCADMRRPRTVYTQVVPASALVLHS